MDFDALSDCTQSGLVALYTTDGTVPTASSKIYEGPITINSTTTIIAVLQVNESLRNIVHNATFRKTISFPSYWGSPFFPHENKKEQIIEI